MSTSFLFNALKRCLSLVVFFILQIFSGAVKPQKIRIRADAGLWSRYPLTDTQVPIFIEKYRSIVNRQLLSEIQ